MKLSQQLKRFILAGLVNTVFGYLVYCFGIVVLKWPYYWSVMFSYVIATSFSYIMFRTFVFTTGDRSWRSFVKFISTYVGLYFVNITLMHFMVNIVILNELLGKTLTLLFSQGVVLVTCAAISFIINRIFVFK